MIAHYLKVAVRNFLKYKSLSLINLVGLSIGIASSILMLLFARQELSYDTHHEHAERVYRVTTDLHPPGQSLKEFATSAPPVAEAMLADFSEIEAAVRLLVYFEGATPGDVTIRYLPKGENLFYERLLWADSNVFDVLSFELVEGNPETALREPFSVIVTESTAAKYFGNSEALGQVLTVSGAFDPGDYKVTGVVQDPPRNSSIPFDMLASFSSLESMSDERVVLDNWWVAEVYTFLLLREGTSPEELESRFPALVEKHMGEEGKTEVSLRLQALTDIHLDSHRLIELMPGSDATYVYGVLVIAFFIILIACVNFMNLSTARSASRAKDVGMRKVSGAYRWQLVTQFLGESFFVVLLSLALAVLVVELALPVFSTFVERDLAFLQSGDAVVFAGVLVLLFAVGLLAGSYPAFFLSSFQPVNVLKGTLQAGARGSLGRKIFVIFQFSISIALIIGTVLVYRQLSYMQNQELGWDREHLIGVQIRDSDLRQRYEVIREEFSRRPVVTGVTFSSMVMGNEPPDIGVLAEGKDEWIQFDTIIADPGYLDTFGLELVAGRNFLPGSESDVKGAFLLNESAVRELDWGEPADALGKKLKWAMWKEGEVVGVVKDFHYQPLLHPVRPMVMHIRPLVFHYCYVRVQPEDIAGTIDFLKQTWNQLAPGHAFEYFFVDDAFDQLYRDEQKVGKIFATFSLIAIFVACLGLFGLASFMAEQRTREIGIRKVHGASIERIVLVLTKELTWLVLLANLVAWPIAYFSMKNWLEDFAYRTAIDPLVFVLAGLAALVIAWLTVSYQSLKAATMSPVRALRYE